MKVQPGSRVRLHPADVEPTRVKTGLDLDANEIFTVCDDDGESGGFRVMREDGSVLMMCAGIPVRFSNNCLVPVE